MLILGLVGMKVTAQPKEVWASRKGYEAEGQECLPNSSRGGISRAEPLSLVQVKPGKRERRRKKEWGAPEVFLVFPSFPGRSGLDSEGCSPKIRRSVVQRVTEYYWSLYIYDMWGWWSPVCVCVARKVRAFTSLGSHTYKMWLICFLLVRGVTAVAHLVNKSSTHNQHHNTHTHALTPTCAYINRNMWPHTHCVPQICHSLNSTFTNPFILFQTVVEPKLKIQPLTRKWFDGRIYGNSYLTIHQGWGFL